MIMNVLRILDNIIVMVNAHLNGTEDEVDKLLKPFSGDSDEFLKFHSITEEYKEK